MAIIVVCADHSIFTLTCRGEGLHQRFFLQIGAHSYYNIYSSLLKWSI